MTDIDWSLLIGYTLEDALEYLDDEEVPYKLRRTSPRPDASADQGGERIIAVRYQDCCIELIYAEENWSVE